MIQSPILSGSLLASDWLFFGTEIEKIMQAGVDWLHLDMMDNHFVPNLTFGPDLVRAIQAQKKLNIPLDVHLMVSPADRLIEILGQFKVYQITVHVEQNIHLDRMIQQIKSLGCRAAVAVNPATPLCLIEPILSQLDMILLMTVNPGFASQSAIAYVLDKIKTCRAKIDQLGIHTRLAVDGGINIDTIQTYAKAGADTFIVGSGLFGSQNYSQTVKLLRSNIHNARASLQ
jgi:ribulose-phosphate 3-epimerase